MGARRCLGRAFMCSMKLGRVVWFVIRAASLLVPLAAGLNYLWWKIADQALMNIGSWIAVLSVYYLDRLGVRRRLLGVEEPADESAKPSDLGGHDLRDEASRGR
jgi:hypothetical protein